MAKISLDTAGLFALTAAVLLLSFLFEKLGLFLWRKFCAWEPACLAPAARKRRDFGSVRLGRLCKTYGGVPVLRGVTKEITGGRAYCLMAPSGAGKTTLLRIMAGLEKADGAEEAPSLSCAMAFQEDRLCGTYTACKNVEMALGSRAAAQIRRQLAEVLAAEPQELPCEKLSGGMKRRVALVRAVMADSDFLLLDEPFSGLDAESKERAASYILRNLRGRTLIAATHDAADSGLLEAEVWNL